MGDYPNPLLPRSSKQRWLKLSSAYSESPLRVGCLEWPLSISPSHALQLQSAAALRALNPIKSRHAQVVSSGLLLYSVPFKSLNPSCHDSGIWSEALRISSHLARSSDLDDPYTPAMLLEAYRLARNQGNLKHAHRLIQQQISILTSTSSGGLQSPMENIIDTLNASADIPSLEKMRIMREMAKLLACRGQTQNAVDLLTNAIISFSQMHHRHQHDAAAGTAMSASRLSISGPLGSSQDLVARSLLVMVKWMQADTRLMQNVWSTDYGISQKMSLLLESEHKCRRGRLGLYERAASLESSELFQPDESVAKFEKHEYSIGQLLHLSTMYCPNLAKAWWALAGWCYRIGRKNLEALR